MAEIQGQPAPQTKMSSPKQWMKVYVRDKDMVGGWRASLEGSAADQSLPFCPPDVQ